MHHRHFEPALALLIGLVIPLFVSAESATASAEVKSLGLESSKEKKSSRLQGGLDRVMEFARTGTSSAPSGVKAKFPGLHFSQGPEGMTVAVELVAQSDPAALSARLTQLGAEDIAVFGRQLSARIPVSALPSLEAEPELLLARPVHAVTNRGNVQSQGDAAIRGPAARAIEAAGRPTGLGVKVGVMSDSFNCLGGAAADQAGDEFPSVTVLNSTVLLNAKIDLKCSSAARAL